MSLSSLCAGTFLTRFTQAVHQMLQNIYQEMTSLGDIFSRESLFFDEEKDINIFSANRYFRMTPHSHKYFEIECVVEGSAIHNPGENQIYLKKGDMVLVPPETLHIT